MTFGKWLSEKRQEARLTQQQLAKRAGISPNYVSALERDEPNTKDGLPRRPREDKVERIAKALRVSLDDALLAAGYAPTQLIGPPQNRKELIEALERIGVEQIQFHEDISDKSPAELLELFDAIKLAVEITLSRQNK
jgi:transcriptional regulator with XRE-family HTH domain